MRPGALAGAAALLATLVLVPSAPSQTVRALQVTTPLAQTAPGAARFTPASLPACAPPLDRGALSPRSATRGRSGEAAAGADLLLPLALRDADVHTLPAPPTAAASPSPTATVTPSATIEATVTPPATQTVTSTPTPPAGTPGVPGCARTSGDAGGFRFSLDGGLTLAPNARRLAPLAYTWDLDVDPRDPNVILELHQGKLYRSADAGCTFAVLPEVPPADWDRLARAPSAPDLLVLTSVFASKIAFSDDGGARWTTQDLPDDVHDLAIDPSEPWRSTFVGRSPVLYARTGVDGRWESRPIPLEAGQSIVSAAHAPSRPLRWLVGSATRGLYASDDGGLTWSPASEGLFAEHGTPPEATTAVVPASIAFAPSDPDVVFAAVNQVGRDRSLRGIWRSGDGGRSWSLRVTDEQAVGSATARLTGGTRVHISPHDPDHVFFAFGMAYDAYGTDLFRSRDGLRTMTAGHFADFYEVFAMAFGPAGSDVVFLGTSSDIAGE